MSLLIPHYTKIANKLSTLEQQQDRRIKTMTITQIENLIRYVTNAEGKATDVLVPLEIWQQIIYSLSTDNISGLALIDEQEPKEQILADLQESVRLAAAGQTFPVSQLWEDATA
jgi:hypothetical protein